MRNRSSLNKFLNHDRKTLYMVLGIVLVCVATLTVAYAALSTTLNISGNAEVTAASWDIHFDNIQINSGSVEATTSPTITDSRTINFAVGLEEPGDYYKFTVDIVNKGTIDAMIDSIVKTPKLTESQTKYVRYEIEYTNGNPISSKQLIPKGETKTISILVAYRTDVSSTDIPTEGESLNLSFTMIYTQADATATTVPEKANIKLISGNLNTVGSEVEIGSESFYIIASNTTSITLLAKYSLYAGGVHDGNTWTAYGEEATGIQDATMIGYPVDGSFPRNGTIAFSQTAYWSSTVSTYPANIYNSNSNLYALVKNYKTYLENMEITIEDSRLITLQELQSLGCSVSDNSCRSAPKWVYSITYWSGTASLDNCVVYVSSTGELNCSLYSRKFSFSVRPVIKIPLSEF